jgi:hypothetical protein
MAYLVVFVIMAAAVYGWKYTQLPPPPPEALPQATAKVYIHDPAFAVEQPWQEILSQSKSEIREHLQIETVRSGDVTIASISLSGLPRDTIVPLVNVVAAAYVQSCKSQSKVQAEHVFSGAQEKLREIQRRAQEADAQLELLRQRDFVLKGLQNAMENARPEPQPSVATVENPQWTTAAHKLAELEEKRRVLLMQRTSAHPAVQEVEMRINEAQREIAMIPPRLVQEQLASRPISVPSATPLPAGPSAAELEAAQQASERLHHDLQRAQTSGHLARSRELSIDLEPAAPFAPLKPATRGIVPSIASTALLTAATSVVGLGMISFGASLEPLLCSTSDLRDLLPVPIVGVLPAVHPGRKSAFSRSLARLMAIIAGLLAMAAVGWLFVRG